MRWILALALALAAGLGSLYGLTGGFTVLTAEAARRQDVARHPRAIPAAEVLETIDFRQRDEFAAFLKNAGTGIPEQRWKWEDPGDFGGAPAHVRAALIQHRPKAAPTTAAPADKSIASAREK